jgi:hypothetical protein
VTGPGQPPEADLLQEKAPWQVMVLFAFIDRQWRRQLKS